MKRKKSSEGKQSSSRMIASPTSEKTQSRPVDTLSLQPKLLSEKFVKTSQSQSTDKAMRRHSATSFSSPDLDCLGPSEMIRSFLGLALAIALKTLEVESGRLKIIKATGVSN